MATYSGYIEPSTTRRLYDIGDRYRDGDRKIATRANPDPAALNPGYRRSKRRYKTRNEQTETAKILSKETKVTVIKWEDVPPVPVQKAQKQDDDIIQTESRVSLFSQQLQNSRNLPHYRYMQYARLDGDGFVDYPRKSFRIFMTMLPEQYQNYPYHVCIMAQATIGDLIGLTCYKYSVEHPEVNLGPVQDYGLCIADDDGEVDWDFPCFAVEECCVKLGFKYLGLIELKKKPLSLGTLLSSDDEISLCSSPGIFCDQRRNNARQNDGLSDMEPMNDDASEPDLLQYCTYEVYLLRTLRSNLLVNLSISPEMLEVTPLNRHKKSFWQNRSHFFMHHMDTVAQCQVLQIKGKTTTFRIIYSQIRRSFFGNANIPTDINYNVSGRNTVYQCHDFVADNEVAKKIIVRLNALLKMRNSPCRSEFRQPRVSRERETRSGCFTCCKFFSCFS